LIVIFFSALIIQSCSKKEGCTNEAACNFDVESENDDGSFIYPTKWYEDADGDGLGNPGVTISACDQPSGYVDNSTDMADLSVTAKQRAVSVYVGATWCDVCGALGEPTKSHIRNTHGSDVVLLSVQAGDAISPSRAFGPNFGNYFLTNLGSNRGIPKIYWSGANFSMVYKGFSSSQSRNNVSADHNINAITKNAPNVGVDAQASIAGNTVTVRTLSKFYVTASTQYIGVYLLEDGVDALQKISGASSAITSHENVLRVASFNGNTLGIEKMGASFTINQEVSGTYTITVPNTSSK